MTHIICKIGDLNEIKKNINDENINYIFRMCCKYGRLEVVKYLIKNYKNIDIHVRDDWAFGLSCMNGHLDVAKWLMSIDGKIDIHVKYEWMFRYSCGYGHLDAVKYLMSIDGKINIHSYNEYAFRYSCEKGHLDVVKYLMSIDGKINIHADNDFAFRWSCRNGHLDVAKYLMELYIGYNYMIDKDEIIIPIVIPYKKIGIMNNEKLKSELLKVVREFKYRPGNSISKYLSVKFNSDVDVEINEKYEKELCEYFGRCKFKYININ